MNTGLIVEKIEQEGPRPGWINRPDVKFEESGVSFLPSNYSTGHRTFLNPTSYERPMLIAGN
jgi:hypothetical protein